MKKTYLAPTVDEVKIETLCFLSVSGVGGGGGGTDDIEWGGEDPGGVVPDAPPLDITPEKLLGIPF